MQSPTLVSRRPAGGRPYDPVRMNLWNRLLARRRRKAHERYLQERERQRELSGQDAQEAVKRAAQSSAAGQQGMYGQGP
jgi:hypothetical protein